MASIRSGQGRDARPVGRPRAEPPGPGADSREDLLTAAARLFASVGYGATTTRQVAAAAGLRQASLFHYFHRKDDMLAELLDRTVEPALESLRRVEARRGARPAEKLAALVASDVENLCGGQVNLGALQLLPEARSPAFSAFWAKRSELRAGYQRLLRAGRRAGQFDRTVPLELQTDIVFGLVESVITFRDRHGGTVPRRVGETVASAVLRVCGVSGA